MVLHYYVAKIVPIQFFYNTIIARIKGRAVPILCQFQSSPKDRNSNSKLLITSCLKLENAR